MTTFEQVLRLCSRALAVRVARRETALARISVSEQEGGCVGCDSGGSQGPLAGCRAALCFGYLLRSFSNFVSLSYGLMTALQNLGLSVAPLAVAMLIPDHPQQVPPPPPLLLLLLRMMIPTATMRCANASPLLPTAL